MRYVTWQPKLPKVVALEGLFLVLLFPGRGWYCFVNTLLPRVHFPDSASYVDRVCRFSTLHGWCKMHHLNSLTAVICVNFHLTCILFQNGRHFSVFLFTCKLALVASLLSWRVQKIIQPWTGQQMLICKQILKKLWPFWNTSRLEFFALLSSYFFAKHFPVCLLIFGFYSAWHPEIKPADNSLCLTRDFICWVVIWRLDCGIHLLRNWGTG